MSFFTWIGRGKRERERAEEIRAHVELYTDELIVRGRTPEAARREARLAFGNPRTPIEEIQHMDRLPVLDVLGRDVRHGVRVLLKTPVFTVTALVTLALVIGAGTAVFSLADGILFRPLPYPEPDRLALVERVVLPAGRAWRHRSMARPGRPSATTSRPSTPPSMAAAPAPTSSSVTPPRSSASIA